MPLSSGARLGSYEILAQIGEGGMGQVWRARDMRLDREVAVKVLPDSLATDGERLARFKREAHLLASLNHPHIAAIYGLEEADGKPFLVLELVEGEDLSQRLARGPIPIDEAIDIAEQIAEALEDAHNKGIVHRDLKPANVKRSNDGRVKVLDFGLAKAFSGDAANGGSSGPIVSQSPTVAAYTGTMAGVILGTAAYMSPEQARGRPVDKRTDVWAFGVLLWEMLTGRTMFAGETVTDVIAAVVTRESDLALLPAETPPTVRRLLTRCLRKDPRQRLPDIGSARLELQEVRAGAPADAATATSPPSLAEGMRSRERVSWAAVCVIAAGLAAALAIVHFRETAPPRPVAARFTIDPPAEWDFITDFSSPALSPDGRQIVFAAARAHKEGEAVTSMLWVRPLESLTAHPLAGTEGGGLPVWTPDGRSVLFVTERELRRFSVADGTVQRICAISATGGTGGLDSNDSGTVLFSAGGGSGQIYSVAAMGGDAKPLTTQDAAPADGWQHMPQFLPDGRRFLFTKGGKEGGVYVASLAAPTDRRRVLTEQRRTFYASGRLIFVREGTLFAQPFDPTGATSSGEPVAIATSVASWASNEAVGWFSASPSGTLAYFSGPHAGTQLQLAWVDRKGTLINKIGDAANLAQVTLSPDGRNAALEITDSAGRYDLWVMDLTRGVLTRISATPGNERDPVWAPDGQSLVYSVRSDQGDTLRRKGLRATDREVVIEPGFTDRAIPEFWLPDGQTLLVIRRNEPKDEQPNVWALPLKGGKGEVVASGVHIDEPQVSPDGRWLAYVSRESGEDEVYLEPFRRQGAQVRVSTSGGGQPKWRADGAELFFVTPNNQLMAVTVHSSGERIDVSLPSQLFGLSGIEGSVEDDYAPGADGQRFLVKLPVEQTARTQLQVIMNWTSLLP